MPPPPLPSPQPIYSTEQLVYHGAQTQPHVPVPVKHYVHIGLATPRLSDKHVRPLHPPIPPSPMFHGSVAHIGNAIGPFPRSRTAYASKRPQASVRQKTPRPRSYPPPLNLRQLYQPPPAFPSPLVPSPGIPLPLLPSSAIPSPRASSWPPQSIPTGPPATIPAPGSPTPSPTQPSFSPLNINLKAGKVYYLPHGRTIPETSIVHGQKRQDGFFCHPVLVVIVGPVYAEFYALTKAPPVAIRDLKMCLRIGMTAEDEGSEVLKLAEDSGPMSYETWVNLEQRFKIEKEYLAHWSVEVSIASSERLKIAARVDELEATQNRFIYKPLTRDLTNIRPGMILMLRNPRNSSTLGAPVVILENDYSRFRFLRIKEIKEGSHWFEEPLDEQYSNARRGCLAIDREPRPGHDGTPVMLITADSPDFRERSYVEITQREKYAFVAQFATWCVPFIKLQQESLRVLFEYIDALPPPSPRLPLLRHQKEFKHHDLAIKPAFSTLGSGPSELLSCGLDSGLSSVISGLTLGSNDTTPVENDERGEGPRNSHYY